MPKIVGRQPSPRVIIRDFAPDIAVQLDALFPTSLVTRGMPSVRLAEWDAAILRGGILGVSEPHLYLLSVGGGALGGQHPSPSDRTSLQLGPHTSNATEFLVPDDLPAKVERLVHTDLLPLVQGRTTNAVLYGSWPGQDLVVTLRPRSIRPFLLTTEGLIIAGSFRRQGDESELWFLPHGADVVAWTIAAVESWRELSPDRFPAPPDWRVVSEWQSAQELAAIEHLATLRLEREATVARLSQQEDQAETERKLASEVADASLRRLLTDQGPTLVNEVLETLIELGFAPQDMDSVHPAGDRREDLRITTPDDPTWEAIAEVRGYQAGAKVNDFLRLSRFAVRYAAEKQRSPSAIWYIANIFIRQSPSERPPMLDSSNDEVEEFSNAGGLVVDTRDLFRLRRAVQDGHLDKVAARRLLTAKTGRFKYP